MLKTITEYTIFAQKKLSKISTELQVLLSVHLSPDIDFYYFIFNILIARLIFLSRINYGWKWLLFDD